MKEYFKIVFCHKRDFIAVWLFFTVVSFSGNSPYTPVQRVLISAAYAASAICFLSLVALILITIIRKNGR